MIPSPKWILSARKWQINGIQLWKSVQYISMHSSGYNLHSDNRMVQFNSWKSNITSNKWRWSSLLLVLRPSFTHSHTLSRAALSCLCNSIASPASVPDTQALLSNTTHRIQCSRLPVRHTHAHAHNGQHHPAPSLTPFQPGVPEGFTGPTANREPLRVESGEPRLCPEVTRRRMLLASRVLMKHGNNFLIALRITRLRILTGETQAVHQTWVTICQRECLFSPAAGEIGKV